MLVAHAHKFFFLDMKSIDALRSIFIRLGDKNTTRVEPKAKGTIRCASKRGLHKSQVA